SDAKEALRNRKVAYLEANGNIFVDQPGLFLWVDSQPPLPFRREVRNRAFTKTGLKVLFHLLQDPTLIQRTQRELAEIAGVALGNIPQVIQGLRDKGYLTVDKGGTAVWQNREELLQRWMIAYENTLRPSLIRGRYRMQGDWAATPLTAGMSVWGGDAAADLLARHAQPQHFVLYTLEAPGELLTKYRLLPNEQGELTALELFWNPPSEAKTAPPLLVYTELALTGGSHNEEPARALYEQYILPNL
ncbi:MAG: type IV toxin-antitoxin system AbiEi family antitoxin, partial [Bacteroidota bacterium]